MMKKSIGIGFVGGGFITRFHIQSLIGVRNCEVLGVMSRTKSSAEQSAALARTIGVGEAKAFETVSDMVTDPNIDAIWICAPNFTRIEIMEEIVDSIENGKGELIGVTCEKPLGRNVKEAKKEIEKNSTFVGHEFVSQIRSMKDGKIKEKPIHGHGTDKEIKDLRD